MLQPRHAKILPRPQAESACRRPAATYGPPILMVGGSAPPADWDGTVLLNFGIQVEWHEVNMNANSEVDFPELSIIQR
jgi:hypothetical protein